jgi:hypothetical protein
MFPHWSGFVLPLPFSEADVHSFYSLSARRVTHATADNCSHVHYSPTVVHELGHYYIGLKALGQHPYFSTNKVHENSNHVA